MENETFTSLAYFFTYHFIILPPISSDGATIIRPPSIAESNTAFFHRPFLRINIVSLLRPLVLYDDLDDSSKDRKIDRYKRNKIFDFKNYDISNDDFYNNG